ncbi:VC0807 family protein [Pseudalkalibacillus sp. Hm43]|uniref:VC0807 family protein n=1 Tax=Pseudalkalibacillus sp. Hm43 TaxID=3450742 RepID=UPI003F420435
MKRYVAVLDIVFYVVFPLIVWHGGRDLIGDYYAMLVSSVPGILYSIYRFYEIRKLNVFGLFMLGNLVVGTLLDVLAGSAMQLLWNNVFYGYAMALLFIGTAVLKKPIALYFGLDLMELQGFEKSKLKPLFNKKKIFMIFTLITVAFALRDVIQATFKIWLIQEYGVEAFDKGLIARQVISWGFSIFTVIGFVYITKLLQGEKAFQEMFRHSSLNKSTEAKVVDGQKG